MKNYSVAKYNRFSVAVTAILIAAGAFIACPSQAASQSSASISNLSYSLIDLNTSDTIQPSIKFQPISYQPGSFMLEQVENGRNVAAPLTMWKDIAPFNPFNAPTNSATLSSGNVNFAMDANAFQVSAKLTGEDAKRLLGEATANPSVYYSDYALAWANNFGNGYNFVLSPNTTILIKGTISVDAQDFGTLNFDAAQLIELNKMSQFYFDSTGSAGVSWTLTQSFNPSISGSIGFHHSSSYDVSNGSFSETGEKGLQDFEISITNATNFNQNGMLQYGGMSEVSLGFQKGTLPPSIPEPGTCALFCLGFGAVLARTRSGFAKGN